MLDSHSVFLILQNMWHIRPDQCSCDCLSFVALKFSPLLFHTDCRLVSIFLDVAVVVNVFISLPMKY